MKVAIILLAAGASSRMGRSKQLLDVSGEPLLLRSVRAAIDSGANPAVVVLGAQQKLHQEILRDLMVTVVYNPDWEKGMGSSLKAGLNKVITDAPSTEAAIIMACDQPLITSQHLRSLIQRYSETKINIVASGYAQTTGVPVLFDKTVFNELLSLEDGQGAKKILSQHPEWILKVDFPGGEIDLDTMEDYEAFLRDIKHIDT